MPALLVPFIVSLGASLTVATVISYSLVFLTAFAYSSYQQRKAKRAARDAFNASLQDRLVMAPISDGTRSRLYGRVRNVDGVIFKGTHGDKSQYYRLVVALAGHECDGIETVYFGDEALTLAAPDEDNWQWVTSGQYVEAADKALKVRAVGTGTPQTVTLPFDPGAFTVTVSLDGDADSGVAPSWFTPDVLGRDVSFTAPAGMGLSVVYHRDAGITRVRIRKWGGAVAQDLAPGLMAAFPGMVQATDHFAGICCLEVELEYDTDVFPTGVPSISAVVRGARVWDQRIGFFAWTENPALIARDWAYYSAGGACLPETVDETDVTVAANACDVTHGFTDSDGTVVTLPLYRAGIAIKTDQDPSAAMDEIVEAMAGRWGWGGGMLKMRAGAYRAPVATITEDWIRDGETLSIVPEPPADQAVNIMRASIADRAQAYVEVQAPEVRAEAYITNDGRELPRETTFAAVTHHLHAQHISGVTMREERSGLTVTLPCKWHAFTRQMFDSVEVVLPHFGFDHKLFEVLNWQFAISGGIVLTLKETSASIFDPDALFTAQDATPNSSLPNPFNVPAITGLDAASGTAHLIKQADGTIVSRVWVTWDEITDEAVLSCAEGINIQYGPVDGDVFEPEQFSEVLPGSATGAYLQSGVQDGRNLVISARARNTLVKGAWCAPIIHTVLGKSEPPSDVVGLSHTIVANGVSIEWTPCADLDFYETELRRGYSWTAGIPLSGVAPTRISGSRYLWPRPAAGTYSVWAKHIDTTRHRSATAALETIVVDEAALVQWGEINGRPLDLFNMVLTPVFESGDVGLWAAGTDVVDVSGQPWSKALQFSTRDTIEYNVIPVHGGERLFVAADVDTTGTPFFVRFGLVMYNAAGTVVAFTAGVEFPPGAAWRRAAGTVDTGANVAWVKPWLQIDGFAGFGTALATNLYIGRAQLGATLGADWADNLTSIPYASVYNNDDSVALGFSMEDWPDGATFPNGWTSWTGAYPTRETGIVRAGRSAVRYVAAGLNAGIYRAVDLSAAPLPLGTFLAGSLDFYLAASTTSTPDVLVRLYFGAYGTGDFIDTVIVPASLSAVGTWQRTPWTARVGAGHSITRIEVYLMAAWPDSGRPFVGDVIFDNFIFALYDNTTDNKSLALTAGGALSTGGVSLGTVTITGLGYTGALDATTDLVLLALQGGISFQGNKATKQGNAGGSWDTGVSSRDAYTGGAYASAVLTGANAMFGLNSDPSTDGGYASIDYAIHASGDGNLYKFESGAGTLINNAWAVGDVLAVVYDGSTARYLQNGIVRSTTAAAPNMKMFFDSSLFQIGDSLTNIRFGPMTDISSALAAAAAAQSTADEAAIDAAAANTELANITSDNVLSVAEKPAVIIDWNVIAGEQAGVDAQAVNYGVTTERTAYNDAVAVLAYYLIALGPYAWNDLTPGHDTSIVGSTFRGNFQSVYTTRQEVLDKIAANAKARLGALATLNTVSTAIIEDDAATYVQLAYLSNISWDSGTASYPAFGNIYFTGPYKSEVIVSFTLTVISATTSRTTLSSFVTSSGTVSTTYAQNFDVDIPAGTPAGTSMSQTYSLTFIQFGTGPWSFNLRFGFNGVVYGPNIRIDDITVRTTEVKK